MILPIMCFQSSVCSFIEVEMIVNAGATAGVVAGSVTVVIVIIVIVVIILIIIIKVS